MKSRLPFIMQLIVNGKIGGNKNVIYVTKNETKSKMLRRTNHFPLKKLITKTI